MLGRARRDDDVGARLGEQARRAHADGPGPGGDDGAAARARRRRPAAACTTAATAVVFDPFESSMTDTRIGPKNAFRTAASSRSPAAMSVPPMKMAVLRRSFGPRVKIAPCTRSRTVLFGDAAVAHDLVRAAVVGDDAIEDAGVRRACRVAGEVCARRGDGWRAGASTPARRSAERQIAGPFGPTSG